MSFLPTVLLILSLPVGFLGYALGVQVVSALPLSEETRGFIVVFAPLFIAGLCMLPFLIPFFDRMAKRDLAQHARDTEAATNGGRDDPDEEPG